MYDIVLYAGEQNEVPADQAEHVMLITEEERAGWFGGEGFDTVLTPLIWDPNQIYWKTMNDRAISAIRERVQDDQDLLLLIGGNCQKPIADATNLLAIEWGVGYEGIFTKFCAFESYAWMHHVYGKQSVYHQNREFINGRAFDQVIPNFFDPDDFYVSDKKDDYLLYIGRLVERKGPHIAAEIARQVGRKLVVAGPGALEWGPNHIAYSEGRLEGDLFYAGEVGAQQRADLMSRAAAVIVPTIYIEPFGGVAVEAMFSGTPVVASDWGAFAETVQPVAGRRFRTLKQGMDATEEAIKKCKPAQIRKYAEKNYSLEVVGKEFDRWFKQLYTLWGAGWYEL
jgi:glycosyltransferase involved in cell wall biosynthesis